MIRQLERALRPLANRLRSLVERAVVTRVSVGGDGAAQSIQARAGGGNVHDDIAHPQPFGFAAHPLTGSEAIVFWPGGARELGIALVVDDRRGRPVLSEAGEVAIFNPVSGAIVKMAADGSIRVTGDVLVEGSVLSTGDVGDGTGTLAEIRALYNIHTHGTSTGPTTPPAPQLGDGTAAAGGGGPVDPALVSVQQGLSAYQLAVLEQGFVGDVEAWLVSLVGRAGERGEAGPKGNTGDTGPAGADSTVPGPQGIAGADGTDSAVPGPTGPDGAAGKDGVNGVDGIDGKDGAPGASGPVGPEGPEGTAGADGDPGRTISATAPGSPSADDLWFSTADKAEYYYDGTRSKWLSVAEYTWTFGRNDPKTGGHYPHLMGFQDADTAPAKERGYIFHHDSTVTGWSFACVAATAGWSHKLSKYDESAGTNATVVTESPAGSYKRFRLDAIDVDFDSGDLVGCLATGGISAVDNQQHTITYRRRSA